MLPLGHLAGSYLITKTILLFFKNLSEKQKKGFLIFGTFITLLPDIDLIYPLFKYGTIFTKRSVFNHHATIFHSLFFWLIISLIIFFWGFFKPRGKGLYLCRQTWASRERVVIAGSLTLSCLPACTGRRRQVPKGAGRRGGLPRRVPLRREASKVGNSVAWCHCEEVRLWSDRSFRFAQDRLRNPVANNAFQKQKLIKITALVFLTAILSHLILDSFFINSGPLWLWPFSSKTYGFIFQPSEISGFQGFLLYLSHPVFYLEILFGLTVLCDFIRIIIRKHSHINSCDPKFD